MPAQIVTVPNLDPISAVDTPSITLQQFSTNVSIFTSTQAKDVPDKLNAVATDVKNFLLNQLTIPVNTFVNNSISTMIAVNNAAISTITTYLNTVVVADINSSLASINSDNETFQSNLIQTNQAFKDALTGNISSLLLAGAGYTISQSNSLVGCTLESATYDNEGCLTGCTSGPTTVSNITYDEFGLVTSFNNTVSSNGAVETKHIVVNNSVSPSLITSTGI